MALCLLKSYYVVVFHFSFSSRTSRYLGYSDSLSYSIKMNYWPVYHVTLLRYLLKWSFSIKSKSSSLFWYFGLMTWRREMVSILVSVLLPEELVSLVSLAVFWPDLRRSLHYQDKPQYFTLKYSARMSLTGSRARLLLSISMWSSVLFFSSFIIFNPNLSWWNMIIKNKTEKSLNAAAKLHLILEKI